MAGKSILNIVDEEGNILGVDTRENIHKHGLLHREVHVWLYTPQSELLFQHRGKHKDTNPDLLDASVGGHVEIGDDFMTAALKELMEETGIEAQPVDLIEIKRIHSQHFDHVTQTTNNYLRQVYAYLFKGKLADLHIEDGESLGFEAYPIEEVFTMSAEEQKKFTPSIFNENSIEIYKKIQAISDAVQ